jgi:Tol biopolymer transport system component
VWTEYAKAYYVLAVAISPDKSKLAVSSTVREEDPVRLSILDTRSGVSQAVPTEKFPLDGNLSWSPDGRRVAYQVRLSSGAAHTYESAIDVIDLTTGITRRVGSGKDPAWSPSGEWIAYLDSSGTWPVTTKCLMSHPDGTDEHVLNAFPPAGQPIDQRYFIGAPVWSPDSRHLLLNELVDQDKPVINMRRDIHLVDLATGKMTTRFRNVAPVLGWATWR